MVTDDGLPLLQILAAALLVTAALRFPADRKDRLLDVRQRVGDLLLALRGDEVLFVREVDGPADVTVVAS